MIRRFAFMLTLFTLLACSFSLGQSAAEKLQVFGGYSFENIDRGGLNGATLDNAFGAPAGTFTTPSLFSGWEAQLQYNATHHLGIVADFSGNYGKFFQASNGSGVSGTPGTQSYSFLFGPEVHAHAGKLKPFVHALFGVNRLSSSSSTITTPGGTVTAPSATDTAFAIALGGGLDYGLTHKLSLRLGQLDYLYTGHDFNNFGNNIFGAGTFTGFPNHENNLRFSTGVVVRF